MKHLRALQRFYNDIPFKPNTIRVRGSIVVMYWDISYNDSYDDWENMIEKLSTINNAIWKLSDNNPTILYRLGGRMSDYQQVILSLV